MPSTFLRRFAKDESGVVAATYAILLIPLVGLAGVAYDLAQMAALDTEVQNAADQAALAAATQLAGTSTSIANATSAASNLLANTTVIAADGKPVTLAVASVSFYDNHTDAEADTNSFTDTAKSTTAKFVKVTIETRQAHFALTPVVGAIMSQNLDARATAGMGSAVCKVPPLMMCNPAETTDPNFTNNYIGDGLELVGVGTGGGAWAPGNFGYLNVNVDDKGNPQIPLKQALGWDSPPGDCFPQSGVSTETGIKTPVIDALNTRFEIYGSRGPQGSCPDGGTCSPSINTVKDLVHDPKNSDLDLSKKGWQEPSVGYQPDAVTRKYVTKPTGMGHPRDICHSVSPEDCAAYTGNARIGDGNWDRDTYFDVNYPGFDWKSAMTAAGLSTTPTRYQVYRWEIAHRNDTFGSSGAKIGDSRLSAGSDWDYNQPVSTSSINPLNANTVDRRTFPVAVVNCKANSVNGGSSNVPVLKWLNMFLVEPSLDRKTRNTKQQDVYVEVVSVNNVGNNDGGASSVVRRDKPYLVR